MTRNVSQGEEILEEEVARGKMLAQDMSQRENIG